FLLGSYERSVADATTARRWARRAGSPLLTAQVFNNLSVALQQLGASDAAERAMARALRLRNATGDIPATVGHLHNLARLKQQRGALHEAALLHARAISLGSRFAQHEGMTLALVSLSSIYEQQRN